MTTPVYTIDHRAHFSARDIARFTKTPNARVKLGADRLFQDWIRNNRSFLEDAIQNGGDIYGTTTGFGAASKNRITSASAEALQRNLIRYHGCGVGPLLTEEECAASLFIRTLCAARGRSGVSMDMLAAMTRLLDERIFPAIPSIGSVGASGDLTPLSYIAAALTGERHVYARGVVRPAAEVFAERGIAPYQFKPREALAVMNGTSVMTAIAVLGFMRGRQIETWACRLTGLLVELLEARTSAYLAELHDVKPHPGQKRAARAVCEMIASPHSRLGRALGNGNSGIQDNYSLRCTPHVVGVLTDQLDSMEKVLEIELNSVNDNPIILHENELILNGGHFFGGHIAAMCDGVKVALGNVVSLLDRQLALIVDPRFNDKLPADLVPRDELGDEAATHHGFKAMQITMSALTSEILSTSMPVSVFSRSTECHNQDVVSLGTIAARQFSHALDLAEKGVAIHAMAVRQGYYLRGQAGERLHLNELAQKSLKTLTSAVAPVVFDRPMDEDIKAMSRALFESKENLT